MKPFYTTPIIFMVISLSLQAQVGPKKKKMSPLKTAIETPVVGKWDGVRTTKAQISQNDNGELSSKNIVQNRLMSEFDHGGHFDCRESFLPGANSNEVCDWNAIRDFIWQHWQDKKKGYIRFTVNSVDAVSTSHIFIEPDEKGDWKITWRIARWHVYAQLSNQVDDILDLVAVEAIKTAHGKNWAIAIKNVGGRTIYTVPGLR